MVQWKKTRERKKITRSWFESHVPCSFDWILWHFSKMQENPWEFLNLLDRCSGGYVPGFVKVLVNGYENAPLGLPQGPRTCRKVGAHPERRVELVLKCVGICWNAPSTRVGETNIIPTSRSDSNYCVSSIFEWVDSNETMLLWILLQLVALSTINSS